MVYQILSSFAFIIFIQVKIGIKEGYFMYSGVLLKWEFFIKMRAVCFAPSFLQKRGVLRMAASKKLSF